MARGEPLIRQWNLLKTLQSHRFGCDLDTLAERQECSTRQVLRDLKVLQEVGFPVLYAARDFNKRFWTLAPQFLEKEGLILTVTEMLSLFLSQQLLAPLGGTELGQGLATALEKIKSLLPGKALDYFANLDGKLLVKNLGFCDYTAHDKEIRIVNQAIAETRVIKIRYQSRTKPKPEETKFCPYGMVFLEGSLYCIGYHEYAGAIRTLKLDRLLGVTLTATTFEVPDDFSLQKHLQGSFGIITSGPYRLVRVRFNGWAATVVREKQWHVTQKVLADSNDALEAQFELSDLVEFKRWVLGFGGCAVVLEPQELAEEIHAELTALSSTYKTLLGAAPAVAN